MKEMVADMLAAVGFNEAMSNSLTRESYYEERVSYPPQRCVKILNPLSSDLGVMRQTLIFNALEAVQLNANHRNPNLKLFEFGNTYSFDEAAEGLTRYSETSCLALTVTGLDRAASWNVKPAMADFFYLRGVVEKVLRRFGIDIYSLKTEELTSDIFANALSLQIGGREFLQMGTVAPKLLTMFDLRQEVSFVEMDFGTLLAATKNQTVTFEELSRYPAVRRDLALLVDRDVTFAALRESAFRAEKKVLRNVSLFDVYEGDKLPAGKKSYALGLLLLDKSKTLTDSEIDRVISTIASRLERDCGATVRS
jgi:phenylalanyl-tRNA synthetase beta chain